MKSFKKLKKGFSMTEILIWVTVVGVFVSLVGIVGANLISRANVRAAKSELQTYYNALTEYKDNNSAKQYPGELQALISGEEKYINNTKLADPWGNPYNYQVTKNGNGFNLQSLGSDKQIGGSGTKMDLSITEEGTIIEGDAALVDDTGDTSDTDGQIDQ